MFFYHINEKITMEEMELLLSRDGPKLSEYAISVFNRDNGKMGGSNEMESTLKFCLTYSSQGHENPRSLKEVYMKYKFTITDL